MKEYLSITKNLVPDIDIWAFDKLDGSQFRCEYNNKRGFYKFGTRREMIDKSHKPFGIAIDIIKDKFEKDISLICKDQKWQDALFFFELYGKSSFAGAHNWEEPLTATLFDVNPHKKGLLTPDVFMKLFNHLDTPKVLFKGCITTEFVDQVKQSALPGMTFEGVICKGGYISPGVPLMFKIKSWAWLIRLKDYCKGNESLFNKLA